MPLTNSPQGDGSSSPNQAIIENDMEGNHASSDEENELDEREQKRLLSNRLAARRANIKKKNTRVQLMNQAQTLREELAEINKQEALYQQKEDLIKMKLKPMVDKLGALQQQELILDAKDEMLKKEEKRLMELRITQQKQLLERNTAMLGPDMSNINPMPNLYPGNEVETYSYMPPDPSQLWIAPVENMQEMNLTPPTNMAFMNQSDLMGGLGTAPNPPNFNK